MPRCPNCKQEIDNLNNWSKEWVLRRFSVGPDGDTDYGAAKAWESVGELDEWRCPECSEVLFRDEESAAKFLLGRNE